jgi:hypothetical protein
MSSYRIVSEVSQALRTILWNAFDSDTEFNMVTNEAEIVFRNPTETARDSANRLSLWLYHITENEHVKNQPLQRGNGHNTSQFPPLALNFFYLITPFGPSGEADQLILGKTMEVLYDNATILVDNVDNQVAEELRVIFCRLSLEELTRIWEALREPYRLSVCYLIRVTRIDSQRRPSRARVVERTDEYFGDVS